MAKDVVRDPIYQQINDLLRETIRNGTIKTGDQFLTERQISEQFGVSRATANKALSNLVSEGILEFRKGVGTFVRGGALGYDLRSLVSFTNKAKAAGKVPSTHLIELSVTLAKNIPDMDIPAVLQVGADEVVYSIERVRLADAVPVILERRYVVTRFCPYLSAPDLEGSLYALWTERYRLEISGADQTIRVVGLGAREAEILGVKRGTAAFAVVSTGYLSGGTPLWCERTLFRGDAYEFHNRLGPLQSARPAAGTLLDTTDKERRKEDE